MAFLFVRFLCRFGCLLSCLVTPLFAVLTFFARLFWSGTDPKNSNLLSTFIGPITERELPGCVGVESLVNQRIGEGVALAISVGDGVAGKLGQKSPHLQEFGL